MKNDDGGGLHWMLPFSGVEDVCWHTRELYFSWVGKGEKGRIIGGYE